MISVIVVTHNREKYLSSCIDSILCQDYKDVELIIVDNNSTDNTADVIYKYKHKYMHSNIKSIKMLDNHIGIARNIGVKMATGEYITFVDDDDICNSEMLSFLYMLIMKNNADISICGSYKMTKLDSQYEISDNCVSSRKLIFNNASSIIELFHRKLYNSAMPTKLFKRELFDKVKFEVIGKFDDIHTTYKLFVHAKKIAYHGKPLYYFRRHDSNNSSWTQNHKLLNGTDLIEYLSSYKNRTEYIKMYIPSIYEACKYFERSFMISMVDKINKYTIPECYSIYDSMIKEIKENYNEFVNSEYIQEFEKEWLKKYIEKDD